MTELKVKSNDCACQRATDPLAGAWVELTRKSDGSWWAVLWHATGGPLAHFEFDAKSMQWLVGTLYDEEAGQEREWRATKEGFTLG